MKGGKHKGVQEPDRSNHNPQKKINNTYSADSWRVWLQECFSSKAHISTMYLINFFN